MLPKAILSKLRLRPCDGLTDAHREQIHASGYDLDVIADEGDLSSMRLHDAAFLTEETARAALGGNYERLVSSIDSCNLIIEKLAPQRVADLGGACGIVCFAAATENPVCQFVIVDRSRNALAVGQKWAQRLGIRNMSFVQRDFSDSAIPTLGDDFDVVLLEYVLSVASNHAEQGLAIAEMTPAMLAASKILRASGVLQVRFGDFNEMGVTALVRTAFRNGLFVESVCARSIGCTITFAKRPLADRSENAEAISAFEDLAQQACADED
jgi:2-polyprenyl-3-methyl-5-hydroxy-6-metoxy-1,4-benzoquinol methylase